MAITEIIRQKTYCSTFFTNEFEDIFVFLILFESLYVTFNFQYDTRH